MNPSNESSVTGRKPSAARELALNIGATLLFFISALLIPVVGFVVGIFAPLPTLLAVYRLGGPIGYGVPAGSALLGSGVLIALGMPGAIPYLLEMLLLGLLLGTGMRKRWSVEATIGIPSLLMFCLGAGVVLVAHGGSLSQILAGVEKDLSEAVTMTLQVYGGTSTDKHMLEESLQEIVPVLVRLMPGAVLAFTVVISWLNVMVTRRYCRIHYLPLPLWPEWSCWKAPEQIVWMVIANGFALMLPIGSARIWFLNILIALATIYFFQGLAVVAFYFERWKLPNVFRALFYGFLLFQQFATLGAILMGLFDMWLDFRRLSSKSASSS